MITVRKIKEPSWTLFRTTEGGEVKVGVIEDMLSFLDVRIQIGEAKAEGYFMRRDADGCTIYIAPNGRPIYDENVDYPFSAIDTFLWRTINIQDGVVFEPSPTFDSENLVIIPQESP